MSSKKELQEPATPSSTPSLEVVAASVGRRLFENPIVLSVLKLDGIIVGDCVRRIALDGVDHFDVYEFCEEWGGARPICCLIDSIKTCELLMRDIDCMTTARHVKGNTHSFVADVQNGGRINLIAIVKAEPCVTSVDLLQLTRLGLQLSPRMPTRLQSKPSPLSFVLAQLKNHQYTFLLPSVSSQVHAAWKEKLLDGQTSDARTWDMLPVDAMDEDWICSICQSEQPSSQGPDFLLKLTCKHTFHAGCFACVSPTPSFDVLCPLCRKGYSLLSL